MANFYTVYYKKNGMIVYDYLPPYGIKAKYFNDNYCPVVNLVAEDLEDVYSKMQGENWSPNGEAKGLIENLKLSHTSMNIGDIIYSHNEDKHYWVSWIGFDEVALTY